GSESSRLRIPESCKVARCRCPLQTDDAEPREQIDAAVRVRTAATPGEELFAIVLNAAQIPDALWTQDRDEVRCRYLRRFVRFLDASLGGQSRKRQKGLQIRAPAFREFEAAWS